MTVNQRVLGSSPRGGAEIEANLNGWLFCFYESVIEFRYAINPFELVVVLKQQSNNILFTFDL